MLIFESPKGENLYCLAGPGELKYLWGPLIQRGEEDKGAVHAEQASPGKEGEVLEKPRGERW